MAASIATVMTPMPSPAEDSPRTWRQTLDPDVHDAREKALRHHRFDLWYGSHHLRFTRTDRSDGAVILRLQERARLADHEDAGPTLLTEGLLAPSFVFQETLWPSRAAQGGRDVDSLVLELGWTFFEHAARLLDGHDARQWRR